MSTRQQKTADAGQNLLRRLATQADLLRQWDRFDASQPVPPPLDHEALAQLLDEAAERIAKLERDR
ncbi:MAG: hypothetical protein J2P55_00255 [Rhizobiales bacterium]|nr:hypothetical protein [Hyphomicrobiales bacterium]